MRLVLVRMVALGMVAGFLGSATLLVVGAALAFATPRAEVAASAVALLVVGLGLARAGSLSGFFTQCVAVMTLVAVGSLTMAGGVYLVYDKRHPDSTRASSPAVEQDTEASTDTRRSSVAGDQSVAAARLRQLEDPVWRAASLAGTVAFLGLLLGGFVLCRAQVAQRLERVRRV
jgi:hypothetical protein